MTGEEVRRRRMAALLSPKVLTAVAWVLAVLAAALAVLLLGMAVAWAATPGVGPPGGPWQAVPVLLFLLASPAVGALIISRVRSDHPIGWLFIISPGALAFALVVDTYATYQYAIGGDLASAVVVRWLGNWVSVPAFASIPFFALLFPDGRSPSRRWTPVIWTSAVGAVLLAASEALRPEVIIFMGGAERLLVPSPLGIGSLAPLSAGLGVLGTALILGSAVLALVALALRFRRSRGIERQQLKWFVFAMGALAALMLMSVVLQMLASGTPGLTAAADIAWNLTMSSLVLLPLSAGTAILRYRLYDIDVLINRALVYGALTATLGVAYVGSVVVLQALLRPFTAENDIAVAASTLAVVALFQPLRRRIQDAVDRRFYRSRYDAQRTLDEFASRLRDEVDLAELESQLVIAVQRTVRPAHARLWLRR